MIVPGDMGWGLGRGRGVDRGVTHVGRRAMLSLIVRILSSHWCTVTRVRAPIGHWPLVLVGRLVVTRVGAGMGQTRPQTRHMTRRPGLAGAGDVEDPLEKDAGAIL